MKVGLLGYGHWGGGFVARNIARVADLAVIVDPDPSRIVEAAATWSNWGTRVATEPEVAFRECDAVWITTPVPTHAALVRSALEHDCDVLCEKPFVLDSVEAYDLVNLATERDRVLMVGHLSLFTETHRQSRRMADATSIHTVRHTVRPSLSDHSALWGLAPHDVASVVETWGRPDTVACRGTVHRITATLLWDEGREATIEVDWLANERRRRHWVGINGLSRKDLAGAIDEEEPLLLEARWFDWLCSRSGPLEPKREEAYVVTDVLAQLERSLTKGDYSRMSAERAEVTS